jgi:hypothetical protein
MNEGQGEASFWLGFIRLGNIQTFAQKERKITGNNKS